MTSISSGWRAKRPPGANEYTITSPPGDTAVIPMRSHPDEHPASEVLRQFAQDLIANSDRKPERIEFMHPTKGLVRLIAPDPEDGALLIVERVGDDEVLGEYFGCERSDLYAVGEKL